MEDRKPEITVVTFNEWKMLHLLEQTPSITHFPNMVLSTPFDKLNRVPALYLDNENKLRGSGYFLLTGLYCYHEVPDFKGSLFELMQETGAKI